MTTSERPPRSLRTKLVVAVLAVTSIGLVAALAVTIVGVNAFMRSRLQRQAVDYLTDLSAYLAIPPEARKLASNPVQRGECAALIVTSSGQLEQYWGSKPAKVPTPPVALLKSMAADRSIVTLPGSTFLGMAEARPNGDYVVGAVSTEDYDQIARRIVFAECLIVLVVLTVLALVLLQASKRWLRPLESVVGTAGSIAGGDLSQRAEVDDSTYETYSLTRSFNTMVSRLQDSFSRRQRAEDRLRRFVASAGHELRTPLSAISGYAQLAQLGALDEPAEFHAAMRRVRGETKRMTALIDELLLLAELDRGRPSEAEPVDLGPLCIDAVHDAQAAAPEWQLRHNIDPHRTYLVVGDAFRLRQTVTNLLANIRAHTPPGTKAEVWLSTTGAEHMLDIIDDGPGIEPELRERVFERFFRANPGSSTGSGLGLSIVAELVHHHGGTIQVLPTDRGCWVRVRLPAMVVPPELPVLPALRPPTGLTRPSEAGSAAG
ncbi:HAMP domain-containing sensor histidine kinase [Amycolatopsis sp. NPDC026612]|uniref:sensor histidine kinase n=1 Tax=Amycolatopsis sp. NPDC026612 TaxID=3155466 RepID=UPI0033DADE74